MHHAVAIEQLNKLHNESDITDAAHFNNLAEISSRPIAFPSRNEESNLKTALGVVKFNVKTVSACFK
jgi:hypothetical protein